MRIEFDEKGLQYDGLEIGVKGFAGDPSAVVAIQVFIEIVEGELKVHVWNGAQGPQTITIAPSDN